MQPQSCENSLIVISATPFQNRYIIAVHYKVRKFGSVEIILCLQSRVPFAEAAQKIFIYSANKQFEGYVTAKSVTDIYYLTHRLTHSDAETRKILSKLFTLFHLLDTTSLDCRKVISPSGNAWSFFPTDNLFISHIFFLKN